MRRVVIASGSALSARAGAAVADEGGNAIDAAVAAMVTAMCTDPGVIAPGSAGFVVVAPEGGHPVVIDAYAEMPGRDAPKENWGSGRPVFMKYGGAVHTTVGYGSVATPGMFAGLELAAERFGTMPWKELMQPAIDAVENGFALSTASAEYLAYSHEAVFGWDPPAKEIMHHADGTHLSAGDMVRIPHLGDTLRAIADEGVAVLYRGDLGAAIASAVSEHGGLLTRTDLAAYEPIVRRPVHFELGGWDVYTNPPPAVGGSTMAAICMLAAHRGFSSWTAEHVPILVRAQRAVLDYRREVLAASQDVDVDAMRLLEAAALGDLRKLNSSPSTTHSSAADTDGNGCAITVSAGYCSGAMPAGTGFFLNNCLGEMELHPAGYHGLEPGTRLTSNMAPTVAHRTGSTLALGSPGASRITTALSSVLLNFLVAGLSLTEAVDHPRLHTEVFEGRPTIAYEPGIPVESIDGLDTRRFPDLSMYFGGVQVVIADSVAGLFGCADPRRAGGVARGG